MSDVHRRIYNEEQGLTGVERGKIVAKRRGFSRRNARHGENDEKERGQAMKTPSNLSPSEIGEIIWLTKSGWSEGAIARKLNCENWVVGYVLEERSKR